MRDVGERAIPPSSTTGFSLGVVLAVTIGGGVGIGVIVVLMYAAVVAIRRERRKLRVQDRKLISLHGQKNVGSAKSCSGTGLKPEQVGCHTPYPSLTGLEIMLSTSNDSCQGSYHIPGTYTPPDFIETPPPAHHTMQIQPSRPRRQNFKASHPRFSQLSAIIESPHSQIQIAESISSEKDGASAVNDPEPSAPTTASPIPSTSIITPNSGFFGISGLSNTPSSSIRDNPSLKDPRAKHAASMPTGNRTASCQKFASDQSLARLHNRSFSLSGEINQGPSQPPPALPQFVPTTVSGNEPLPRSCSKDSLNSTSSASSSILEECRSQERPKCNPTQENNEESDFQVSERRDTLSKSVIGGPRSRRVRSNIVHNRLVLHSTHGSLGDNSGRYASESTESGCRDDRDANLSPHHTSRLLLDRIRFPPRSDSITKHGNLEDTGNSKPAQGPDNVLEDELPGLVKNFGTTAGFATKCSDPWSRSMTSYLQPPGHTVPTDEEPRYYYCSSKFSNQAGRLGVSHQTLSKGEFYDHEGKHLETNLVDVQKLSRRCHNVESNANSNTFGKRLSTNDEAKPIKIDPSHTDIKVSFTGRLAMVPDGEHIPPPCSPRPRTRELPNLLKKKESTSILNVQRRTEASESDTWSQSVLQGGLESKNISRLIESPSHLPKENSAPTQQRNWCPSIILSASPPQLDDASTVILTNTDDPENCNTAHIIEEAKEVAFNPHLSGQLPGKISRSDSPSKIDIWATKPYLPPPKDPSSRNWATPVDATILNSVNLLRRMTSDSTRSILEVGQEYDQPESDPNHTVTGLY